MSGSLPKELKNIYLLHYYTQESTFKSFNEPNKPQGLISKETGIDSDFDIKDDLLIFYAFCKIEVFNKDETREHNLGDKIFELYIKIKLIYAKDNTSTKEDLKNFKWYFNSQADIILRMLSEKLLNTTRFKGISDVITKKKPSKK